MRLATTADQDAPKMTVQIIDRSKLRRRGSKGRPCGKSRKQGSPTKAFSICGVSSVDDARNELCRLIEDSNR